MDIWVLNKDYQVSSIIDSYVSFIWTERRNAYGDFELVISDSHATRERFSDGSLITHAGTNRVMFVDSVLATDVDTEEGALSALKVTGKSLESKLQDRSAEPNLTVTKDKVAFSITGSPAENIHELFRIAVGGGSAFPDDILPWFSLDSWDLGRTIPLPPEPVTFEIPEGDSYSAIKAFADMYTLGFGIVRTVLPDYTARIHPVIYTGDDRTTRQTENEPVLFSPEFGNLVGVTELLSSSSLKNVAYVRAQNGYAIVTPNGEPPAKGFERRVLNVKADDITLEAGPQLELALTVRGREELAKHRSLWAVDGEIPQNSNLIYGKNYNLGDLVEVRNRLGSGSVMRIEEQIFSSDRNGARAYPTLVTDELLIPGTWAAWPPAQDWVDAPGTWIDL